MLKQLQQMQAKMAKMQQELDEATVSGTAGGGAVTVTVNGQQKVMSVTIEPDVLEEGAELLADMVMAATNDALDKSRDMAAQQMGQLTAGLGLPPGLL
ncbi:MAG TPA: YbaB/EbfC family nucleoid-associated protein [Candidatus Angelobacter sp.]|nr:YbaB/EbfC family nucleoid-associated protein [Candidatus Angelobacter sp.]